MLLRRDLTVAFLALGSAAALYVMSFRDLMATAAPAIGAPAFEQSDVAAPV